MAKLITCKDCGNQISKNAPTCPSCGAKNRQTSIITWLAAIFIGLPILISIFSSASDDNAESVVTTSSADSNNPDTAVVTPTASWDYEQSHDEMRGTTQYFAGTQSQNAVQLDWPYEGDTTLQIVLRNNGEGNDVMVVANQGQLWCEYRNCTMDVKFDDAAIESINLTKAAAGASETMFITNADSFINKLKSSDTAMLEIGFYDNGANQFKFDTSDLNWTY